MEKQHDSNILSDTQKKALACPCKEAPWRHLTDDGVKSVKSLRVKELLVAGLSGVLRKVRVKIQVHVVTLALTEKRGLRDGPERGGDFDNRCEVNVAGVIKSQSVCPFRARTAINDPDIGGSRRRRLTLSRVGHAHVDSFFSLISNG